MTENTTPEGRYSWGSLSADSMVYSTTTNRRPVDLRPDAPLQEEDLLQWWDGEVENDPFCFVCGRCTDHFAEHDDLVEAGLARYEGSTVLDLRPRE